MSFSVIQDYKQKIEQKKFPPIDTLPETCFYTMGVYYMAAKVKKTRWTLSGALLATAVGIAASAAIVWYL